MAYLNGNHVPNLLRARTLITKLIGTICSVSAGFPMGPEGPMVHIGACLASVITYAQCSKCLAVAGWHQAPVTLLAGSDTGSMWCSVQGTFSAGL